MAKQLQRKVGVAAVALAAILALPVFAQDTTALAEQAAQRLKAAAANPADACAGMTEERNGWFDRIGGIFEHDDDDDDDDDDRGRGRGHGHDHDDDRQARDNLGCIPTDQSATQNGSQPPANGLFNPGSAPRAQLN
ncbi:hypothetical protein [Phaeovulum sp.]|uniref:hypothetical protein n=1 Tax=Phaeovulum sp. TaxID=2934796 RepID=UPI00356753C5